MSILSPNQVEYREYLNSVKWKTIRDFVVLKSNSTCQECNKKTKKIQVHHLTYKNIYNEKPEDLICLCSTCHKNTHHIIHEKIPKRKALFPKLLRYKMFLSPAFRDLKPAAKDILILMFFEIQSNSPKQSHLILPYKEIKENLNYTEKTIWTSIKKLLAHGFINVVKKGGKSKGDFSIYKIENKWESWKPGLEIFKLNKTNKNRGFIRNKV